MNSIKTNGYASFKYRQVLANDPIMQDKIVREEFQNREFGDHCHDIFQGLFQKDITYNTPSSGVIRNLFDNVKETPEFKALKERTTNKHISAYIGMQDMLPQLEKTIEELQKQGEKPIDQKQKDSLRQLMRGLVRKATEKVEDTEEAMRVLGIGKEKGCNTPQDIEEALLIAKRIASDEKFKKMMMKAGREQHSAETVMKTDCTKGFESIVGITVSDDIMEVVPSELIKPAELFEMDWHNGKLFCNKYKGKKAKEMGAFIGAFDRSGSMGGLPLEVSNRLMFGMYTVAASTNRKMIVNLFDSHVESYEIKSVKDVMNCMQSFSGGGTDFNAVLMRSFQQIESNPEFKSADIVFITDGQDTLSEETLKKIQEMKKKISLKIIGLMIGRRSDTLKQFCDKIFCCTDDDSTSDFCKEVYSL